MKYKEKQLDYALKGIMSELVAWGLCDNERTSKLGHRTPETLHLSVDGATLILDLINTLSVQYIETLNETEKGNNGNN